MFRVWKVLPLALAMVAGASLGAAQSTGRTFYVDCGAAASGTGSTPSSPWNSLTPLNARVFGPRNTIALRRGATCHGTLAPQGSGTATQPIRLTAYGEGPRPKVIADASAEESLRLFNQENWDIDSLDLSGGRFYGVFISGNKGILHHIHLQNMAVHDVFGGEMKHKEGGLVSITPGTADQHFDDVLVDGVTAWNTNQWVGILIGGGDLGYPPESDWSSNVEIRNSTIHDVQGDGIVLFRDRAGRIDSSVAWNTGMQQTETIGTPNAIWTWMCDDCTVENNEAYLTDSPGVDGGAYDIDYGNTKNSVIDNYAHDTQGYCVAVFGAGFVTRESLVRGNLCVNNARSPRMAKYQGAIFLLTWNGGSIDGLTIENNTVYWNPFENAPAVLNGADIRAGSAVFRNNTIESTAPWLTSSHASLSFTQNQYTYFGAGEPQWRVDAQRFASLAALQAGAHQEQGSSFLRRPLRQWPGMQGTRMGDWRLDGSVPVALNQEGLLSDAALQQIVVLKSLSQQYRASGLRVTLRMTSPDAQLFRSQAFRNAVLDLDLKGMTVTQAVDAGAEQMSLTGPTGKLAGHWDGFSGPTQLGLALREAMGEPVYAQMRAEGNE